MNLGLFMRSLIAILAVTTAFLSPTSAQVTTVETVQGVDLAKVALPMKPQWANGVLRVRVSGLPSDGSESLRVRYGKAGEIDMNAAHLSARTVSLSSASRVLELPVIAGETMMLVDPPSGVKAVVLDVISPNRLKPEQRLEGSKVISIDNLSSPLERAYSLAFARLRVYPANEQAHFDCTAFRIAKGYWITAAHCGYRSPEVPSQPIFVTWRLQPQNWAGQLETSAPLDAKPVASGLRAPGATSSSTMALGDLDWMLLQVDGDQGGPSLPLLANAPQKAGTYLALLQHSIGNILPAEGKAVSAGESCKLIPDRASDDASNPELCLLALRHGCSSQRGASGGALVSRSDFKLVAIHYRAGLSGLWNCGVPAASVALDLCSRFPTLADKVLTCPSN